MIAPSRGIVRSPQAEPLGVLPCERVKQVSDGKQCEPKSGTPEIDVVPNALLEDPNLSEETSKVLQRYDRIRLPSGFLHRVAVGKSPQFFLS